MKELFTKGHVRTPYYRLVAANGNFAWLMTDANTTQHTCKGQRGQYVVCVHYIIGIQEPSESLVVCTDTAPAGLPVEVKKEIDDLRGERAVQLTSVPVDILLIHIFLEERLFHFQVIPLR